MTRPHPRRTTLLLVSLAALATALVACSSDKSASPTTTTTPATDAANPCSSSGKAPKTYAHVVMVLEENRTWSGGRSPGVGMGFSGGNMPYLSGLAARCSYYTDWEETNGEQNSLNQYIGLTSGVANPDTVDDCTPSATCQSTDNNIFRQIRTAGGTPRTFVDNATEPCSAGKNAPKHIPALYYQGGHDASFCTKEVLPLSKFDPNALPTLSFIVPDLCNDGHDCSDETVDSWARKTLAPVLASKDYRAGNTLVVVVYDEDQPVPNLLIAPTANKGRISSVAGSHADLLKTIEEALGLKVMDQGQLPDAVSLRSSSGV